MTREAIILAGGFGTRLRPVVSDVPKPMADIGGRPFLACILMQLERAGYGHAVISTGYLAEVIETRVGGSWRGMQLSYAREEEALGTGGGVMNALAQVASGEVTVLNGDSFLQLDLEAFRRAHSARKADITIALASVPDVSRYGSVILGKDKRIERFQEKGTACGPGLINGGVYQLNAELMKERFTATRFSLEKDVFETAAGFTLCGFESDGYFIDIGIPGDYARAVLELPKLFEGKR